MSTCRWAMKCDSAVGCSSCLAWIGLVPYQGQGFHRGAPVPCPEWTTFHYPLILLMCIQKERSDLNTYMLDSHVCPATLLSTLSSHPATRLCSESQTFSMSCNGGSS